ncbi:endosome-associated-trafficking regulator 1-like isoform X2 [Littorina saxatilis]|uniref:endosome-associated-trafficking regulator 1-like isoform X2 n=1 Tax=Littorina saxatilis TaxID=31220 RepID=UPI0038B52D81
MEERGNLVRNGGPMISSGGGKSDHSILTNGDSVMLDASTVFNVGIAPAEPDEGEEAPQPSLNDGDTTQTPKTKTKGNPFSFKKFLGQSGQKEGDSSQRKNPPADLVRNESTPTGIPASSLGHGSASALLGQGHILGQHAAAPPDFASDLPDFIQNHYGDDQGKPDLERHLPDFTLGSRITQDRSEGGGAASFFNSHRDSLADTSFSDDEDGEVAQRGQSLSLPDFLVDSTMPGAQKNKEEIEDSINSANVRSQGEPSRSRLPELPPLGDSVNGGRIHNGSDTGVSESAIILQQLREENRQLQDRIAQMQRRARDEVVRVAGLEKEISRLQKKEAEETAVMERAVQQVEENLVSTTTRAVKAETMVTKLKQEVKTLQSQVKVLTAENEALQSGDKGLSDIRERTKYASQQLAAAAVTAETNLRELMGGVEKLKLLGQVLGSLEKVTDVDSSTTHESPRNSPT